MLLLLFVPGNGWDTRAMTTILFAIAMILIGAGALRYQSTGTRRYDAALVVAGIALVASGIAVLRDGVEGSRKILWMVPGIEVTQLPAGNHVLVNNTPAALLLH